MTWNKSRQTNSCNEMMSLVRTWVLKANRLSSQVVLIRITEIISLTILY